MSAKRDSSRQRRVNQNRAARDALVARRQAAQKLEPEPAAGVSRRGRSRAQAAPVVPARAKATETRTTGSRSAPSDPVEHEPPASGVLARTQQLAGGRQMLAAFVLAVVATVPAGFLPMFRQKGERDNESFIQIVGARGLVLLLVPVVFAAIPLLFLHHPRRRLAWNIAAFLMGLWILFVTSIGIFYLFAAGAMVWGVMKTARSEGPAGSGLGRFPLLARRNHQSDAAEADEGLKEPDGS